MYINVDFQLFCDMFNRMNRRGEFSYNGLRTLFDYFEELESDTGEQTELDVISICCSYNEYLISEALLQLGYDSEDELRDSLLVLDVDDETIIINQ